MMNTAPAVQLALVGDYRSSVPAHVCLPHALTLAGEAAGVTVHGSWIPSESIDPTALLLAAYDGIWAIPGSPYRSVDGVLSAIRFARERPRPFLGTCGGFQHALIELARNVLHVMDADHAESNPGAIDPVIAPLTCPLMDHQGEITLVVSSRLRQIYSSATAAERYRCGYGLSPRWRERFETVGLHFTAFDREGAVRAAELPSHPFFIGTLFQPERSAPSERAHPLITAFVRAAATNRFGAAPGPNPPATP
ncbi:MAG TPA: hypothetical protein VHF69_10255 [Candidatus Synoicihabitans sp.]|nr:hypothetical protein [Candidatus Synoicihabitans sp.]